MTGPRIASYALELPEGWSMLPPGVADLHQWPAEEAARLLARSGRQVAGPVATSDGPPVPVQELLARALSDVVASVRDAGLTGLRVAVLVRRPDLGAVDAMLTVLPHRALSPEAFVAEFDEALRSPDGSILSAREVRAQVPAGAVHGAHLLIGHLEPDETGPGVAHLEERVALGVFPPGAADMLEVTVVAQGVETFADMPQEVVDVLGGLAVTMEPAA